ncbi:MAG TPA: D-galactonate transporter [Cyanobacteria bacterium UBA11162]|nr:D-galactonate transporter [Cyanobacteria bacterium UBA11162]
MLVVGYWLLVVGYWLLAVGYWLLVVLLNHNYQTENTKNK